MRIKLAQKLIAKALGKEAEESDLPTLLEDVEKTGSCVVKLEREDIEILFNDFYGPDAIFLTSAKIDLKNFEAIMQSCLLIYKLMYPDIQPLASELPKAIEFDSDKLRCMLKPGDTAVVEAQILPDPKFSKKRQTGKISGIGFIWREGNPENTTGIKMVSHVTSQEGIHRMRRRFGKDKKDGSKK